jgi:hypothetical protein
MQQGVARHCKCCAQHERRDAAACRGMKLILALPTVLIVWCAANVSCTTTAMTVLRVRGCQTSSEVAQAGHCRIIRGAEAVSSKARV